jgi:hypothetical protein
MLAGAAAVKGWGGAEIREGEGESDYDRLLRKLKGEITLDRAGRVFWEVEPGVYAVGVSAKGDELVVLEPADWDDQPAARHAVEGKTKEKSRGTLATKERGIAVVWSPSAAGDLRGLAKVPKLPMAKKAVLRREGTWAIAIGMKAGTYAITTGSAEGHRWCRLRLTRT